MLPFLLAAVAPLAQDSPPWLAVQGTDEIEAYEVLRYGLTAVPLLSRSERVPRPEPGRRGLGIVLIAGAEVLPLEGVDVRIVEHDAAERVLVDDDEPYLVGPPRLPSRIGPDADALAWLARQDGATNHWTLQLEFDEVREDERLVAIAAEGYDSDWQIAVKAGDDTQWAYGLTAGPNRATIAHLLGREVEIVTLGDALDQLYAAHAQPLTREEWPRLEVRLERGELERLAEVPRLGFGAPRPRWNWKSGRADGEVPTRLAPGEGLVLWLDPEPPREEGRAQTLLLSITPPEPGPPPTLIVLQPDPERPAPPTETMHPWRDVAREAGVAFMHLEGPDEQLDIRPTMGPGVAWGDFDGDGWNDLYLVQGGGRAGSDPLPNRLYRNLGHGTFEDVTADAGVGDTGAGMGALFLDGDGDGDLDLYVANYGADALFENRGDGTFVEVGERLPRAPELWSAGICAGDADGDGDLDLYVTSYLDYDLEKMPPADDLGRYRREDPLPMLPFAFPGQRNVFLRNEGGLRFTDATEELGLADAAGRGMQAVFWDFDGDADLDLYVANDVSPNVLFRNEGDGTFRDVSFTTGLDDPRGGMGLALGDTDRDGDEDLFLTNWELEANALYLSSLADRRDPKHRRSTFRDATVRAGMGPWGVGFTSWGAELFDMECDGDLDLFVANGYTSPDYEGTGICVGQRNHLFENDGRGRFTEIGTEQGPALAPELPSRAAVGCDYDRDGDVDLAVTANNSFLQLLRNDAPARGAFLGVRLRQAGPNPFAIGAEVRVRAGEAEWTRSLRAGTSYLGGNPPELHFGLGDVEGPVEVTVRWPDGASSTHAPEVGGWRELRRPE